MSDDAAHRLGGTCAGYVRTVDARQGTGHPRVVFVVGAGSGIGLASAVEFASSGARLVLAGRDQSALDRAAAHCRAAGATAVEAIAVDVRDDDGVRRAVETCLARHGRLDVAVNSSSTMAYGSLTDLPADVFRDVVATAIFGTANVARAVLPIFARQEAGTLVVVNSLLGSVTVPYMGAYAVAKWGQRALVRTLQQETRKQRGVHVCLVSPGSVNTPIYYQAANYVGRGARPPVPVRSPEAVARSIATLADRPRRNVSMPIGVTNPVIIAGYRLVPFVYDRIAAVLMRRLSLTGPRVEPTPGNVIESQPQHERMHGHWPDP